ncbi:MAG TPA: SDR family oxidoreductase [Pyrinomonadaceae bacterium]
MKITLKPIGVQVAVVFGASSGIGRLAALEFARRGAKVCVAARGEAGLKSLVAEIEAAGGEAFYVVADAAVFEQVKDVAEKTVRRYGRIDTWIHSAAVFLFATVEKTDPEEYKHLIEINLLGQIYGAKAALPHLKEKGGALIHISSVEAYRAAPYQSAYGASKHALAGFLKVLRVELEHDRIPVAVTQILPAAINTPIYRTGRNKMLFKPRPVPPIYHPQIVVDAILYAAENPVRDLVAGGAGLGVVYAERISPRLADWASHVIGYAGQDSGEASDGNFAGNLFEPITGKDRVEGEFSGEQLKSDPYTWLQTNPKAKNGLLLAAGGIFGGILAWRMLKDRNPRAAKGEEHAKLKM